MTDKTDDAGLRGTPSQFLMAAIAAAAKVEPVIDLGNGRARLLVPDGFKLADVDDPHRVPPYIQQKVVVDDRASLVAYVNRFSDERSILIADYDAGVIGAMLDFHSTNLDHGPYEPLGPGPCEHKAALVLRPSEEFTRWSAIQGKRLPQAEFAAFLEENATDIVRPEPAVMIEISRDLEATQGVTFKSSTRLESGDRAFVYETETRTRGEVQVPREFTIEIPIWHGEAPVPLRCAFRWKIEGGGLVLGFEWRRVEYQRRADFAQVATKVAEATGRPLVFGRLA